MTGSCRAIGQPGLGAGSDCCDPVSDHSRSGTVGNDQYRLRHRRNSRRSAWAWSKNTRIGVSRTASSISPGRIARWSCDRSMPPKPTRNSMDGWPALSFTPIPHCALIRASSSRTAAGNPVSGATPFPAICRSCCCRLGTPANIDLVRQLVQAHAYWRLKGLAVDLVIWNEDHAGYRQLLQDQIMGLIAAGVEANVTDRPGGIFVRPARPDIERGPDSAAIGCPRHHHRQQGTLADQLNRRGACGRTSSALQADSQPPSRTLRCPPSCRARSDLLQRARRIHAGWARVRHYDHAQGR